MHSVVVLAIERPVLVGLYRDGVLVESFKQDLKSTEALPIIFEQILSTYKIDLLIYANGPGSFMAIKVAYLFLKTISIVNNIPLKAQDAFFFNQNSPIKAVGKLFFVKTTDAIETRAVDCATGSVFKLPESINIEDFTDDSLPFYGISAIG